MSSNPKEKQFIGFGVGLRRSHYDEISQSQLLPDWFEIISENYMHYGARPAQILEDLRQKETSIIPHGVGLSLGSIDPFDTEYLKLLKNLIEKTQAPWFSDHLCFSSSLKHHYHDLIPILRTQKTLDQIIDRIKFIEDFFQVPFIFENISYYGESDHHQINEVDFINKILEQTESGLLLDINNVYVNSQNLSFDAEDYIDQIDLTKVQQVHLAGHWDRGDLLIDTHGDYIPDSVWKLYGTMLEKRNKPVSTLIEWDHNLPTFETLCRQALKAKGITKNILGVTHGK